MGNEQPQEGKEKHIDWKSLSDSLRRFVALAGSDLSATQRATLHSLSLMAEVDKDRGKAVSFLQEHRDEMRRAVFAQIEKGKVPDELAAPLLRVFGENNITSELYAQLGKRYQLSAGGQETTDCVRILRQSPTFRGMVDKSETTFFSEGSDLVLSDVALGKVVAVVNEEDFAALNHYKPTEDKVYIFGLVKPPLYVGEKPNITHLQIPTDVRGDRRLAVINASSDKGKVVIEPDIQEYLKRTPFVRVYVIEVDLKDPYPKTRFEREPFFETPGFHRPIYKRPHLDAIPSLAMRSLELIEPEGNTAPIDEEEVETLERMSDDRVLEYLTILTGIREGKIGHTQNIEETLAFRTVVDPDEHSLGLHQITKVVTPLFNTWIENIDERTAKAIGDEVYLLWQKKQQGKNVEWADLIPYINSYDITDEKYTNVRISTICAYLLMEHLYRDQLLGAYAEYGETFYGLEENPEAIIAIASAYRSSMGVLIRGSQQYRVAEMAHHLGILNADFSFTPAASAMPEFRQYLRAVQEKVDSKHRAEYHQRFLPDGYRGVQTSYLAYFCYKKLHPDGQLAAADFVKVYDTSQRALLSPRSKPAKTMREDYERMFGEKPSLLLTEDELRGSSRTGLKTRSIKFANEGLWVAAHFRKLAEENWQRVNEFTAPDGASNNFAEEELEQRALRNNEISKVDSEQGRRFRSLIENLPDNPWYKRYPEYLMAACFVHGLFLKEGKHEKDGRWIIETQDFIREMFTENLPAIEGRLPPSIGLTEENRMQLAVMSSVLSIDEIVHRLVVERVDPDFMMKSLTDRSGIRLRDYSKSFDLLRHRFATKDRRVLARKEKVSERERQERFVLQVFDVARTETLARGLPLDFALVATSMASLECGWGRIENEWNEPTLYAGANNIFSIKYDNEQYTETEYDFQDPLAPYYVHHTKEYLDPSDPTQFTEHFEAFRKYDSIGSSVKDFFDLVERNYPLTMDIVRDIPEVGEPDPENQESILQTLYAEKYATDPEYAVKALTVGKRVTKILRQYAQII